MVVSSERVRSFSTFLVELLLVAVACVLANLTGQVFNPVRLFKYVVLSGPQLAEVTAFYLAVHAVAYGLSRWALPGQPFQGVRRTVYELPFVFAASAVASSATFLLSLVPFVANLHLNIHLLLLVAYLIAMPIAHRRGAGDDGPLLPAVGTSVLRLVRNPWTVLAVVLVLSPGALAAAYKKSKPFANQVNALRARIAMPVGPTGWKLVDAFPGQRFEQPMQIRFVPGRGERDFYLLSRTGRLYRYQGDGDLAQELILDISEEVGIRTVERGALSFDLHPEFGQSGSPNAGYVYVYYTHATKDAHHNRVSRFDVRLPTLDARNASRFNLIDQERPNTGFHNGGTLFFGPDGFLYYSCGDYATKEAQTIDRRLSGGIFRIDVDQRGGEVSGPIRRQPESGRTAGYFIPKENPFYGRGAVLEEYYALGFRNPFRFSLDTETGDLWVGDVGWDGFEEVSRIRAGANGQWPYLEAARATGDPKPASLVGEETDPFFWYPQTALDRAVIGGFVYRGDRFPSLDGKYVFADNNSGIVRLLDLDERPLEAEVVGAADLLGQSGITSLTPSPDGYVLITALGSPLEPTGRVYRLVPSDFEGSEVEREPLEPAERVALKYEQSCSRCHGYDGRGADGMTFGEAGENIDPRDFSSAEWQASVTDEHILEVVRKGGEAVGLSRYMPPWDGAFTDEEWPHLVAMIRAFGETGDVAPAEEVEDGTAPDEGLDEGSTSTEDGLDPEDPGVDAADHDDSALGATET